MPFQWQVKQLGSILRGRGVHQCLVITTTCGSARGARELALASLDKASIRYTELEMDDARWPTVATVQDAVFDSRELAAQAVVGIGADGVLDAAKAASVLSRVAHDSPAQFLGGLGREAVPPSSQLPMVAVLTRPSLAGSSGRCLVWNENQLAPLRIQGDSSHWGIGPGLPPTVEIVDAQHALGSGSSTLSREQHTLVTGAAALAAIVDMRLATAHTIKADMLRDSTHSAVASIRSVLADPAHCEIDALSATRVAGMATTNTDATAYAHVPVLHALACAAAGALPPSPPDGSLPYVGLNAAFLPAVLRAVGAGGSPEEQAAVDSLAESLLLQHSNGEDTPEAAAAAPSAIGLARYLDDRFETLCMPTVRELLGLPLPPVAAAAEGQEEGQEEEEEEEEE
eukprot:COSAG06_NODE_12322_length_1395_cov_3.625000_1_plen_398_part_10